MRLDKIFSFVDECDIFADIGCDHGYLSKAVADSGKAKRIICFWEVVPNIAWETVSKLSAI